MPLETPIARLARRLVLGRVRPSTATTCTTCGVHVDADEGVWDSSRGELQCGAPLCEVEAAAARVW